MKLPENRKKQQNRQTATTSAANLRKLKADGYTATHYPAAPDIADLPMPSIEEMDAMQRRQMDAVDAAQSERMDAIDEILGFAPARKTAKRATKTVERVPHHLATAVDALAELTRDEGLLHSELLSTPDETTENYRATVAAIGACRLLLDSLETLARKALIEQAQWYRECLEKIDALDLKEAASTRE
jgi:hypothetical protein